MEPVFIYFDKVKFDDSDFKIFTIKFSDADSLNGVLFRKTNDYYLTSMTSSITIEQNLKELKDYDDIKKIHDISKAYLKNGLDYYETFPLISSSIFSDRPPHKKLLQDESKMPLSVVKIDYFDVKANKESFIYIYSGYKDLRLHGLKFTNEDVSLKLDLVKERDELYIEQKVSLIKSETDLLKNAITDSNNQNIMMIYYNREFYPIFLPIAKYYFKRKATIPKQRFEREVRTHNFIYKAIFDGFRYNYVITKDKSAISDRFPIWIGENNFTIKTYSYIYLSPSLYLTLGKTLEKKKSFTRKMTLLDRHKQTIKKNFPNYKNDFDELYLFANRDVNNQWEFNINDFSIPNANVNIKSSGDRKQNIFNFFDTKNPNMSAKVKAPKNLIENLESKELTLLKSLSEKVKIKSLTHAYENFFLYDLENMINPTFTTELQKQFNIYGLIYFSGEAKENNKLHLVRPANKLKFQFNKNTYKKEIKFELSKVHKKKTFNVVGDYISNFSMFRTEKRGIGQKRKQEFEIVEEIPILGIQNSEFNVLNPIHVSINSDSIITKLQIYKRYRYRFILQSLLFSSNIENETDVIIVSSNGLNNAKQGLIKKNNQPVLESTLGVCFLSEITDWNIIKGQSKRSQAVFSDSEDLNRDSNHLAFSFITKNISDLLQFSVTLLDGAGKQITFPSNEKKLPIITFRIQIIK